MNDVSRVALEQAICAGANISGEWRLCKKDGSVYWYGYFSGSQPHLGHSYLRLPSLFPEGSGSKHRLFCLFAKQMASRRGELLLSLARGTPSEHNPSGEALATPCIIERWLTPSERTQWEHFLSQRVAQFADGCLVALNNEYRRARFRFAYPFTATSSSASSALPNLSQSN